MLTKMVMPQLNPVMKEGVVSKWYKRVGDRVREGEAICELEADKAVTDLTSPVDGWVKKIYALENNPFPVREVMIIFGDENDIVEDETINAYKEEIPSGGKTNHPPATYVTKGIKVSASPVAKRIAIENNIDLQTIIGTGPGGLIGKDDVLSAVSKGQIKDFEKPDSSKKIIPIKGIKKIAGDRVTRSYNEIPHIYLSSSCDASELVMWNKRQKESLEVNRSNITDLLIFACSKALRSFPFINGCYGTEGIHQYEEINIGLAVAGERGLVVPVIRNSDSLDIKEITKIRVEIVKRARAGSSMPDEIDGATFTISNLGMLPVDNFTAIINPGNAAILSIGRIREVLARDKQNCISFHPRLNFTLGCDHRVIDGFDGAKFLEELVSILETPSNAFT